MASAEDSARRLARAGWAIVLLGIAPLAAWVSLAPLATAVVAPAVVTVDLKRRPVQHLEGGIVEDVPVRDGQAVRAGDPVLVLGDVRVEADRDRLLYRVRVERAALARFEAERALATSVTFGAELLEAAQGDERIAEALSKERALFEARRASLSSEVALMRAQRERVEQEIASLRAQIERAQDALAVHEKDLAATRSLHEKGLIAQMDVWRAEAAALDGAARLEERRSELARAEQRLVDSDLRIGSVQNDYVRGASDELAAASARLRELEQELRKCEDAAARQVVTAPASGTVIDLRFTSPGAVVGAGVTIAEIVPDDAALVLEARVRPEEVTHVHLGQRARVRFTASRHRNASVTGHVAYVSADRLVDRATNLAYYAVTIRIDASSLESARDLTLQAGMPAEAYLEGRTETPLEFLIEPLRAVMRRAAREM